MIDTLLNVWFRYLKKVAAQLMSFHGFNSQSSSLYVEHILYDMFCLFVFVALRPKSTAMVITGRSVHLTTLFPGQA